MVLEQKLSACGHLSPRAFYLVVVRTQANLLRRGKYEAVHPGPPPQGKRHYFRTSDLLGRSLRAIPVLAKLAHRSCVSLITDRHRSPACNRTSDNKILVRLQGARGEGGKIWAVRTVRLAFGFRPSVPQHGPFVVDRCCQQKAQLSSGKRLTPTGYTS